MSAKQKKVGRTETPDHERHEWAAICGRIHRAAGAELSQEKVAEALSVKIREIRERSGSAQEQTDMSTRQWGYYLGGKRCPMTLEKAAEIIEAAEELGWYSPTKPTDWLRQEQLVGHQNPGWDFTPADQTAYLSKSDARQQALAAAQRAIKALRALNTYPAEILADVLPERAKKPTGAALPPASYAEMHRLVGTLWTKLESELAFRMEYGG